MLVIGGGITGAGVARDAALRGLSVALVERRDFSVGTSSRSSKLVHGGLRYLEQGHVSLVRESARERFVVRRLAPHLARPSQMVFPVGSRITYAKIKLGLWIYDKLAKVSRDERSRMISQDEAVDLEPALGGHNFYGAGLYYEYLTDDARLVLEVLKSAATLGATIVNYTEVTGFLFNGGRVSGVSLRDESAGVDLTARARVVINAAGPWVDAVRLLCDQQEKPRLTLTKGIHLVFRREQVPVTRVVVLRGHDKRLLFAIPHGAVTYVGTTDTFYDQPDEYPAITMDDVTYVLDAVERTLSVARLTPEDIVGAWAGLRPLLAEEGKAPSEISRRDEIMTSQTGLLSIAGGKLTTFRRMAERIVDKAVRQLCDSGRAMPKRVGESDESPLSGGDTGDNVAAFAERLRGVNEEIAGDIVEHMVGLYGSNAEPMLEAIKKDPALGKRCSPRLPVTRAEVEYAVHEEMALTLADVLDRRTRQLLWDPESGVDAAETVAGWMGELLGWSPEKVDTEVAGYRRLAAELRRFDAPGTGSSAA